MLSLVAVVAEGAAVAGVEGEVGPGRTGDDVVDLESAAVGPAPGALVVVSGSYHFS